LTPRWYVRPGKFK